jgi:hypothetical protein
MDADNASYRHTREVTSHHSLEEHPNYGEVLHLLHALRYLVRGSTAPLVDPSSPGSTT